VAPFVARKVERQAQRFALPFLTLAVRRLAAMDSDIKTGEIEASLALDLFVSSMCGPSDRRVTRAASSIA
jgi:DNA polymerase III delta subunit